MTLIERIKQDQVAARKEHSVTKALLLTTLIGEAQAVGKNNGNREPTDAEVVAIVKKFIKNMDETIGHLEKANPNEKPQSYYTVLIEKEHISKYLPKQLTDEEIRVAIKAAIEKSGSNLGKVMTLLKLQYEGLYDGKLVSSLAKEMING